MHTCIHTHTYQNTIHIHRSQANTCAANAWNDSYVLAWILKFTFIIAYAYTIHTETALWTFHAVVTPLVRDRE